MKSLVNKMSLALGIVLGLLVATVMASSEAIGESDSQVLDFFNKVERDEREAVAALLQSNPELAQSTWGALKITPLHEAVALGRLQIVKMLLAAGAKPDEMTVDGVSPLLFLFAVTDIDDEEDTEFSLPHLLPEEGYRILIPASVAESPEATESYFADRLAIIRELHEYGANMDATTPDNTSLLHAVAANGMNDFVTLLLSYGAEGYRNNGDEVPLDLAAINRFYCTMMLIYNSHRARNDQGGAGSVG